MMPVLSRLLVISTTAVATFESAASVPSRDLQDCPTLCSNGGSITLPDNLIPLFPDGGLNCSVVDQLLAAQSPEICAVIAQYGQFLDFGAWCGCEGSTRPDICEVCSGGGAVTDASLNFTIDALGGASFSCQQGATLAGYLSNAFACSGFTAAFDPTCCRQGSPAPGMPTTTMPAMPSAATTPSPSTMMMPTGTSTMAPSMKTTPTSTTMSPIGTESSTPSEVPSVGPGQTQVPSNAQEPTVTPNAPSPPTGGETPAPAEEPTPPSTAPVSGPTSGGVTMSGKVQFVFVFVAGLVVVAVA